MGPQREVLVLGHELLLAQAVGQLLGCAAALLRRDGRAGIIVQVHALLPARVAGVIP